MPIAAERINELFASKLNLPVTGVQKLAASGGDRRYYRVASGAQSFIATESSNAAETDTFLRFTELFKKIASPVPAVLGVNEDRTLYVQEDLGDRSLLDVLQEEGETPKVKALYEQAFQALVDLQLNAHKGIDYSDNVGGPSFDKQAVLHDLLYFKFYFLDTLGIAYNKVQLQKEFDLLSSRLSASKHRYFMYRDFQSRNIMVKEDKVYFIDYQGGMEGPMQYDVASLLWQAKANLSDEWKNDLLQFYINAAEKQIADFDRERFLSEYNDLVLLRLLQVLGAYGFRGLFEKKAHFISSIPQGLSNLKKFLSTYTLPGEAAALTGLLKKLTSDEVIHRFQPVKATADTPLTVHIKSFSFIKSGYPKDTTTHGGGFVFDCRGILNPGRVEEHKLQTGRDLPVQQYLHTHTRMAEFLAGVYSVVDIAVEDYIKRGFADLSVNFGCTGGQHRSVFAADALALHLKEKFAVKTTVQHLEQNFAD